MTLGIGLFTLFDASSSTGVRVGFQFLVAARSGLIVTSSLPAAQAELPKSDVAASAATWAFLPRFWINLRCLNTSSNIHQQQV